MNTLIEKLKTIWKYPQILYLKKANNHYESMYADAVVSCGVCDIKDNVAITQNEEQFSSFKYAYQMPSGIDSYIDSENELATRKMLDALECKIKLVFIREKKKALDENIAFFEIRRELEKNDGIREIIEHELRIQKRFNAYKYVTPIMEIDAKYVDDLHSNADHLYLKQLSTNEMMKLFCLRNNEME